MYAFLFVVCCLLCPQHVYKSKKELVAMLKEAAPDGEGGVGVGVGEIEINCEQFIHMMETNIGAAISNEKDAKPALGAHKGLQLVLACSSVNLELQALLASELTRNHPAGMVAKAMTTKQVCGVRGVWHNSARENTHCTHCTHIHLHACSCWVVSH